MVALNAVEVMLADNEVGKLGWKARRVASLEDSRQQVQAKGGTMQGEGLTDRLIRHARMAISKDACGDPAKSSTQCNINSHDEWKNIKRKTQYLTEVEALCCWPEQ